MCSDTQYTGYYLEKASLAFDESGSQRGRTKLSAGKRWVLYLTRMQKGFAPLAETARQTDVMLEFTARPTLDSKIDLSAVPKRCVFEYGGQKLMYVSKTMSGTLTLTQHPDGTLFAVIDAQFTSPVIGDGTQVVKAKIPILNHSM